jgi:hypothetical protein
MNPFNKKYSKYVDEDSDEDNKKANKCYRGNDDIFDTNSPLIPKNFLKKHMNNDISNDISNDITQNNVSLLYFITHLILSFFAVYLSWRCSNGIFNIMHFSVAFLCPHLYIIWALATHGGCGIFGVITTMPILETVSLMPKLQK